MGKVTVAGGVRAKKPSAGISASEIAVGSSVYLNENGSPVEYMVVNQGIPSDSSLYDSSCDGIWLLRKNLYERRKWDGDNNNYKNSDIHAYLNSTFINLFDNNTKSVIKQVTIPYVNGTGSSGSVSSGSRGLSTKIFLLSCYEVGFNSSTFYADGACLDYFIGASATDSKRIGYFNGTATFWWLRTPSKTQDLTAFVVMANGSYNDYNSSSDQMTVRPALILPSTARFDKNTLLFKGGS